MILDDNITLPVYFSEKEAESLMVLQDWCNQNEVDFTANSSYIIVGEGTFYPPWAPTMILEMVLK